MNTSNEFQLIWEYNLLRTFVRHVFMVTWNEKIGIDDEDVLNLNIAKLKNNPPAEDNSFFEGQVEYNPEKQDDKGQWRQEDKGQCWKTAIGIYVGSLPEIKDTKELNNSDIALDFMLRVRSYDLSYLRSCNIFNRSIQSIADDFLKLSNTDISENPGAVLSFDTIDTKAPTVLYDRINNINNTPRDIRTDTHGREWYTDHRGRLHRIMHHDFDMSSMSDTDYTDAADDENYNAECSTYSKEIHKKFKDTDDYFVRGVIVPMMAAYVGCDQLFESEQDKNADVHLNRLYDMVNEQIDVNDHKSVLDYMSKVKFMIPALLPEA